MQVKKEVLRKLPTDVLNGYIKSDSRYTSQAVQYAFEILQHERGFMFSDEEILKIQNLIKRKTQEEQPGYIRNQEQENNNSEINSTANQTSLFSKNNIIFLSIIFSPLLGGVLLFYNLKVVKKNSNRSIILILLYLVLSFLLIFSFNVLYNSYLQKFVSSVFNTDYLNLRYSATTFKIAFKTVINLIFINYLWKVFFGDRFSYRAKDITIPIIICLIIYMVMLFFIWINRSLKIQCSGVGSVLAGGNLWQGALIGGIVAGLNHAMHKIDSPLSHKMVSWRHNAKIFLSLHNAKNKNVVGTNTWKEGLLGVSFSWEYGE